MYMHMNAAHHKGQTKVILIHLDTFPMQRNTVEKEVNFIFLDSSIHHMGNKRAMGSICFLYDSETV